MGGTSLLLPPGFRFHPTDEEIITHYLTPKILNHGFIAQAMGVVELNKYEPWDLPGKANMGEEEWFFFCQRTRRYPTGTRTNRATVAGYWKATGKDKQIHWGREVLVGMRKTLVFYTGRAPNGEKSSWVMHEYRLHGNLPILSEHQSAKDEWVVCRVSHKKSNELKKSTPPIDSSLLRINSFSNQLPDSFILPPLMNPPSFTTNCAGDDKYYLASSAPVPNSYLCSSVINYGNNGSDMIRKKPSTQNQNPISREIAACLDEQEKGAMAVQPSSPELIKGRCKAEQFSNHSMLSQDTGLSTDRHAEVSSAITDIEDFDLYSAWRW